MRGLLIEWHAWRPLTACRTPDRAAVTAGFLTLCLLRRSLIGTMADLLDELRGLTAGRTSSKDTIPNDAATFVPYVGTAHPGYSPTDQEQDR